MGNVDNGILMGYNILQYMVHDICIRVMLLLGESSINGKFIDMVSSGKSSIDGIMGC